jgi:parallel beta-helix repeat protein
MVLAVSLTLLTLWQFSSVGFANSVINTGAETDTSGWNTSGSDPGATLGRDTNTFHSGGSSFRLDTTAFFKGDAVLNDSPNWITSAPGDTCTASAWVRAGTAGVTARIRIKEYAGSSRVGASTMNLRLNNTDWQQLSITRNGITAGNSLDLNIYGYHISGAQTLWIDDVTEDCSAPEPTNVAPTANLSVTPSSGTAPLAVTADASASSDPDNNISSYSFSFGDGTAVGPQTGAVATHTYSAAGSYQVDMTVTDSGGLSRTASQAVIVNAPPPPPPATPTFYVDKNNSSCSNSGSGSANQPYCSISAGAAAVTAGQVLVVHGGTYNEQVSLANSGTSTAPITIKAAEGETVTLSGSAHGFYISAKSYITIDGFNVTTTSSDGILLANSNHITLTRNSVSNSGLPLQGLTARGIRLSTTTASTISSNNVSNCSNSGIYIQNDSPNNIIRSNQSNNNASAYTRQANGIDNRGNGTIIDSNTTHNNEDSGIQNYPGGASSLVLNNTSYNNGDHGIDNYNADHIRIFNNTVYHNVTAGINLEGDTSTAASNSTVENNIAVDNGINSPRTTSNIRVDTLSVPGTSVNYNLVYLSQPSTEYIWGKTGFSSQPAFRTATGQEQNGLEANPKFADQANGNFSLSAGSNAIDSADSSFADYPATDSQGNARYNDPNTIDSGGGTTPYADRGAFEFQG